MAKEITSVKDLQEKFKQISEKRFYRMVLLMDYALYKKDGTKTAFAKKYDINDYNDLYNFFKKIKHDLKNDHEDTAFFDLAEFTKSIIGRLANFLYVQFQMQNKYFAQFVATIFTLRTIGFVLDNLLELKEVFKELTNLKKREDINIAGEVEESQQIKLEKEEEYSKEVEEEVKEKTHKINLKYLLELLD